LDKMTLILDKKNITLSPDGKSLRIDCPGQPFQRIPLGMVGNVVVHGNAFAGCNVWRKLAEAGIQTLLFPARGSGEPAWIGPGLSGSVMVRLTQHKVWADHCLKLSAAAWIVRAKLAGFQHLLNILEKDGNLLEDSMERLNNASSTDAVRGIEGLAARLWFNCLADILDEKWGFSGRNRRPPRDPVNALLSLGYTLLVSEIRKAVYERGLDPCIGFLHEPYPGRESLVLDLVEPFRAGVDAFVLSLAESGLEPDDFTINDDEGCRLSKNGRGVFYNEWENAKINWPLRFPNNIEDDKDNENPTLQAAARHVTAEFVRSWGTPTLDAGTDE
jgi:CRISP-associated protein Cas1